MDWIQTIAGQQMANAIIEISKEIKKSNELKRIELMLQSDDCKLREKGFALLKEEGSK